MRFQLGDVIAQTWSAEFPEIGQIFAELRSIDAGAFGDLCGRSRRNAIRKHTAHALQISAHALDRGLRNLDAGFAGRLIVFRFRCCHDD
jgi:hypothetical protein